MVITRYRATALALLALIPACGSAAGSGSECSLVGGRTGVGLEVRPPLAAGVARASMRICRGDACRTSAVRLDPSTTTRPGGCSGGTCSGTAVRTGGVQGFVDVPGLPKAPVTVTVVLRDASGGRVLDRTLTVTPKGVFPNGPRCGEAGRQTGVVAAGGRLTERR
ncbi:hypothetical protein [Actinomadura sp. DC4]|uniref:hypothetical protein n=1 Tax=Actinomadura sp. DC4 TaxID=3055069 RepID=UPI0025AF4F23|nr:hypothetical protein [Actinomadura sp. DC4]MDN3357948.1 hypothetical protein [Actinomadura sp. DC4]